LRLQHVCNLGSIKNPNNCIFDDIDVPASDSDTDSDDEDDDENDSDYEDEDEEVDEDDSDYEEDDEQDHEEVDEDDDDDEDEEDEEDRYSDYYINNYNCSELIDYLEDNSSIHKRDKKKIIKDIVFFLLKKALPVHKELVIGYLNSYLIRRSYMKRTKDDFDAKLEQYVSNIMESL